MRVAVREWIDGKGGADREDEGAKPCYGRVLTFWSSRLAGSWLLRRRVMALALIGVLAGCSDPEADPVAEEPLPAGAQARSYLGEVLFPPPLDPELQASREDDLMMAQADLEANPDDPEAWIWVGRHEAYLGEYRDAIQTFSRGLDRFPDDARFLRHRGHRYLTVREPDRAQADLEAGLDLALDEPDEIEPDGLPNVLGIPLTTLHFNLWYHLGLARYIQGDFEGAASAWESCMEVSTNPDLQVATGYWLYLTLGRLDRGDEADRLIRELPSSDDVIENDLYLQLLRLYAGEVTMEELLEAEEAGTLGGATLGYGVAMHHLLAGDEDQARSRFHAVLQEPNQWAAFGYMAAEAEVARQGW